MLKFANVAGRSAALSDDGRYLDLEMWSHGEVTADPMMALTRLGDIAGQVEFSADAPVLDPAQLGPPVPRPSKIIAAGINYFSHAEEAGFDVPTEPALFARLPSALTGPQDAIHLPAGRDEVDWEAEVVVVIGRRGKHIAEKDAWSHVVGLTAGQDISDRAEQFRDLKQFTMGKSFDSYAPLGPSLVTVDAFDDPDDIGVRCVLNGEEVQTGRTSECIFSVPQLIAWISNVCTLEPGDLIFTGTPPGVGYTRKPAAYLRDGDVLETFVDCVGAMRNVCVNGSAA